MSRLAGVPYYTVTYRTRGSDDVKVATFHASPDRDAGCRAYAFMTGIDQSGGMAGFPQWHNPTTKENQS